MGGDAVPPPDLGRVGEVCSLGTLLEALVERSYHKLVSLSSSLRGLPEPKRQEALLRYIHGYRQQLLRLVTLVGWLLRSPSGANKVAYSRLLLDTTTRHQGILQETADKLFFLWRDELQVFRAPVYDIPTALEVLTTGTCCCLPTCIAELCGPKEPTAEEKLAACRRMDMVLRCCLLDADIPEGVSVVRTTGGVTTLVAEGKYQIGLTLLPPLPTPEAEAASAEPDSGTKAAEAEQGKDGKTSLSQIDETNPLKAAAGSNGNGDLDEEMQDADEKAASAAQGEMKSKRPEASKVEMLKDDDVVWRWCITEIVMLPGSARAAQLTSLQHDQLRQVLQAQMWEAAKETENKEALPNDEVAVDIKEEPNEDVTMADAGEPRLDNGNQEQISDDAKKAAYSAPLALMHRLLSDIAARLLVDGLVSTARSLAQEGGAWNGNLRMSPLTGGTSGVALTYWPGIPPLVPVPEMPQGDFSAIPEPHPPPEIQLELKDRDVVVKHAPELTDPLTLQPVALVLEPLEADAGCLLTSAATANAWVQLYAVFAEINSGDNIAALRAAGGMAELKQHWPERDPATQEEASQAAGLTETATNAKEGSPVPCIELKAEGSALLMLQMDLHTGKLILKSGHGLGGEGGMDVALVLKAEEAKMQQIQANPAEAQQLRSRSSGSATASAANQRPLTPLAVITERLVTLFQRLAMRDHLAQLMVACRSLRLQYMPGVPRHLFEACTAAGSRGPAYYLAFPPMPLPLGFPLHKIRGFGSGIARAASRLLQTQVSDTSISPSGTSATFNEAVALRFHLGVDNVPRNSPEGGGRGPMSRYVLFVSTASYRGTALQAIRRIIVPQSALDAALKGGSVPIGNNPASGNKRKRENDDDSGSGEEVPDVKVEDDSEGNAGNPGQKDNTEQWGLRQMEELAGAVFWCQRQLLWELIRAQLDALQVAYSEEVILPQQPEDEPGYENPILGRRINLLGLNPQHNSPQDIRASIEVENPEEHPEGRWTLTLTGDDLPGSDQDDSEVPVDLPRGGSDRALQPVDGGISLAYSLVDNHSILDTLGDVERTVRCSVMVQRLKLLLNGPAKAPEPVVKGPIKRTSTTPVPQLKRPNLKEGTMQTAALPAYPGCGEVSITGVGLMSVQLDWIPPRGLVKGRAHSTHSDSLLGVSSLRLVFRWVCEKDSDSQGSMAGGPSIAPRFRMPHVACKVTSQPPVLDGALKLLGEMVMDGEEGLMIDALRCCAAPWMVLAEAMKPVRPCTVLAECNTSPYVVTLMLKSPKALSAQHRVSLRFYARGSVWLCLHPPKQEAFQPLPELQKLLPQLGKINQEFSQKGGGPMPLMFNGKAEEPACWVHTTLLDQVLEAIISHVGCGKSS